MYVALCCVVLSSICCLLLYPLSSHANRSIVVVGSSIGGDDGPPITRAAENQRRWTSALAAKLPHMPTTRIYCLYGRGIPTESGYYYKRSDCGERLPFQIATHIEESDGEDGADGRKKEKVCARGERLCDRDGVMFADGDGTVPLPSLSYMCTHGWTRGPSRSSSSSSSFSSSSSSSSSASESTSKGKYWGALFNPSAAPVVTREYAHLPPKLSLNMTFAATDQVRGELSSDHVNILGNVDVLRDIISIAATRVAVDGGRGGGEGEGEGKPGTKGTSKEAETVAKGKETGAPSSGTGEERKT